MLHLITSAIDMKVRIVYATGNRLDTNKVRIRMLQFADTMVQVHEYEG